MHQRICMRLFAVMGTSSTLLLRAAFCKPWTSVVLFHTDDKNVEIFRNQMRIYSKRNGLALPTIEGFEIPPVDTLNSLSDFIDKVVPSMPKTDYKWITMTFCFTQGRYFTFDVSLPCITSEQCCYMIQS